MYRPVALCARNFFETTCPVCGLSITSTTPHTDVFRNPLQRCFVFFLLILCPGCNLVSVENPCWRQHSVSLQMVFDDMVCCPLVPRKTNIVPALVPVGRACPSVIFHYLKRMLKDVTGPPEGPLPGVDVSSQQNHSMVFRISLNTVQRGTTATGNNVLAALSQHTRVS